MQRGSKWCVGRRSKSGLGFVVGGRTILISQALLCEQFCYMLREDRIVVRLVLPPCYKRRQYNWKSNWCDGTIWGKTYLRGIHSLFCLNCNVKEVSWENVSAESYMKERCCLHLQSITGTSVVQWGKGEKGNPPQFLPDLHDFSQRVCNTSILVSVSLCMFAVLKLRVEPHATNLFGHSKTRREPHKGLPGNWL